MVEDCTAALGEAAGAGVDCVALAVSFDAWDGVGATSAWLGAAGVTAGGPAASSVVEVLLPGVSVAVLGELAAPIAFALSVEGIAGATVVELDGAAASAAEGSLG